MARLQAGLFDVSQMLPSLSEGFKAVASAPRRQQEKEDKTTAIAMMNKAVSSNNPQQLAAAAQALSKIPGMEAQSLQLAQLAQQRSSQIKQGQARALEVAGQEATQKAGDARKKAQMLRAIQVAEQRNDKNALAALEAKALDPVDYLSGLAKAKPASPVSLSPGGALVSPEGRVLYERPFKPEATPKPTYSTVKTDNEVISLENGQVIARIPLGNGETEASASARIETINKTNELLDTVDKAIEAVGFTSSGLTGQVLSNIGGTEAYTLRNSYYQTIAGQEAMREISRLKAEAEKYGSKGTGLGQITAIEFSALQGNLASLNTGLPEDVQKDNLNKIKRNLQTLQAIAAGQNVIDAIDFETDQYAKNGFIKLEDELFYFPPDNSGREFVYNRDTGDFEPIQ